MYRHSSKLILILVACAFCFFQKAEAQKKSKYGSKYKPKASSSTKKATSKYGTTTPAATNQTYNSNSNSQQPVSKYGKRSNANNGQQPVDSSASVKLDYSLPLEYDTAATAGGLLELPKPSMKADAPYKKTYLSGATPLAYQSVREDDVPFKTRVWREIDTREKINRRFNYGGDDPNTSYMQFINILLAAMKDPNNDIQAFKEESFSTPITFDEVMGSFGGGMDTVPSYNLDGVLVSNKVMRKPTIVPDSITKFRIKEDWFFDRNTSKMYVRIIGIAPVVGRKMSNGMIQPNSERPLFWVYYPDLRPTLVKTVAYNPYNPGDKTTWEAVFEGRQFSSKIIKSDLNNPSNLPISKLVPDKMFQLYEGEKVKEKIFDYEQSLWSY